MVAVAQSGLERRDVAPENEGSNPSGHPKKIPQQRKERVTMSKVKITADQVREARRQLPGPAYDTKMSPASDVAQALNKVLNGDWKADGSRVRFGTSEDQVALSVTTGRYDSDRDYRYTEASNLAQFLNDNGYEPTDR